MGSQSHTKLHICLWSPDSVKWFNEKRASTVTINRPVADPFCFCKNGSRKRYSPKAIVSIWCFLAPFLLILDHCKICRLISLRKGDCLWSTAQWPCPEGECQVGWSPLPSSTMKICHAQLWLKIWVGQFSWPLKVITGTWLRLLTWTLVPLVPPDKNERKAKLMPYISSALLCWVINKLGLILFWGRG